MHVAVVAVPAQPVVQALETEALDAIPVDRFQDDQSSGGDAQSLIQDDFRISAVMQRQ